LSSEYLTPLLTAERITKTFGRTLALENVNLDVQRGELLVLVGPSGCGKTTLLRILAGFESPASGTIKLDGEVINDLPPDKRKIGIVFQDYALFPHMNVEKNVRYGLRFVAGISADEQRERVDKFLDLFQIRTLKKRMPHEISAGQQQRVAIARSLAPMPDLLLLDEPFSALDLSLRDGLRRELKRIQRELEISMIHVTHDQDEALAIGDRVVVMNQGRVEQIGPPSEVYQNPASSFVASFIGRGNLLTAHVDSRTQLRLLNDQPLDVNKLEDRAIEPGLAVMLFIRSEAIQLANHVPVGASVQGENTPSPTHIKGYLRDVEYLGDRVLLHVNIGGQVILVKTNSERLSELSLSEGTEIHMNFPKDDIKVFPV